MLFFSADIVQMNHYKTTCPTVILPECRKYLSSPVRIVDTIIFKYKHIFMEFYRKIVGKMKNNGIYL